MSASPQPATNYEEFTNALPVSRFTQIKDFMDSNNFVAKITFLIFVLFICLLAYQLMIRIIVYIYSPKNNVILLDGTVNASVMRTISQSATSPSHLVIPSTNQQGGIEFTWSVWIYITELSSYTIYNPVFFKGTFNPYSGKDTSRCGSLNMSTNAPGLYVVSDSNTRSATLQVMMDTTQKPSTFEVNGECAVSNQVNVPHIPLNNWVNVVIRCTGNEIDVYVNGVIANSVTLSGVPKQNNGDIYVAPNGGFNGFISTLQYMNKSATNAEIQALYQKGPNKKALDDTMAPVSKTNYFAFNWYATN